MGPAPLLPLNVSQLFAVTLAWVTWSDGKNTGMEVGGADLGSWCLRV